MALHRTSLRSAGELCVRTPKDIYAPTLLVFRVGYMPAYDDAGPISGGGAHIVLVQYLWRSGVCWRRKNSGDFWPIRQPELRRPYRMTASSLNRPLEKGGLIKGWVLLYSGGAPVIYPIGTRLGNQEAMMGCRDGCV
jgi:hypothetical protein